MSEIVTELVISADTAGADVYGRAMQSAEDLTKTTMQAVAGLGKEFGSLGAAIAGGSVVASLAGFIEFIKSSNKDLADMATVAHLVGLTLTDFQGIKFGGAIAGLSTDQVNAGLEKSAALLNDASRNSNSLSKELEANGLSVKNANGQLITENQLLTIAGNLIKNANNPGDQIAIAQMLGFTKEWIPLLERGGQAMSGLAGEAKAAGAVIDDETIRKATEFDTQWRKSSVEFSAYMKAALFGIMPFFDNLIERSERWINSLDRKKIEEAVNENLTALADPLHVKDEMGVAIHITPEAQKAIGDIAEATSIWDGWIKTLGFFAANKPFADVRAVSQEEMKWFNGTGTSITDTSGAANTSRWLNQADALKNLQAGVLSSNGFSGSSRVAGGDAANDQVDRAINTLRRHAEQMDADARAVGLGDAALASYRATAAETAAVQANGGKETAAQTAEFEKQRLAVTAAADALAKAKVVSQIEFGGRTAFLSADDVAIANQLKGMFGNEIPAALNSTYAASIRVNNGFKSVSAAIDTDLTSGLTDIVTRTKSVSQGFTDMGLAIVKALDQAIIKLLIVGPLMRALQGGAESAFPNLFAPLASTGETSAVAGALSGMMGGVPFPMFAGGTGNAPGGWSVVGENGPELMKVPTGAQILPNGASPGGRSTQVNVSVMNFGNDNVSVNQKPNGNGGVDLEVMVGQAAANQMAKQGSALRRVTDLRGRLASR